MGKSSVPKWLHYCPVAQWERHLQVQELTATFHYPDPLWTYDEGLLIFPSAKSRQYEIYDVGVERMEKIELELESKIVRRIRLKQKVFVVEWCEEEPHHQLNEKEMVYRHFATVDDISQDDLTGRWSSKFRYVWLCPNY